MRLQQQQLPPPPSPPPGDCQPCKDASSFSSCTSSPWDVPDDPFQALQPAPARAQSVPLTLPSQPLRATGSQSANASPPRSADAFASVSWSQSQWIAFSDHLGPRRRPALGSHEVQKPPSSSRRPHQFLADDSGGSSEDSATCLPDPFSGIADSVSQPA